MDLVRKGALAADRMSRDPDVAAACDDLARLADFGALAGVAEVIRERLRQVEELGYTPDHDDGHSDGLLAIEARWQLSWLQDSRGMGTADVGSDEDHLRKAGALAAAEIDRLNRMLTPEDSRPEKPR